MLTKFCWPINSAMASLLVLKHEMWSILNKLVFVDRLAINRPTSRHNRFENDDNCCAEEE